VTLYYLDAIVIAVLGGIIALLSPSPRWPISLAWLKALEKGLIGMLAILITFTQYRQIVTGPRRRARRLAYPNAGGSCDRSRIAHNARQRRFPLSIKYNYNFT
jgi:hypothetical protein